MTKAKKIAIDAMLSAMYVVLCFCTIKIGTLHIAVSSIPVILGALLFGPVDGLIIGLLGAFIEQMITYGPSVTTVLWLIPLGVRGLLVGAYAKRKNYDLNRRQLIFILVLSALVVTTLNTVAVYLDSVIWGYYSFAYVFGNIIMRYVAGVLMAILLVVVMPGLLHLLRRSNIFDPKQ